MEEKDNLVIRRARRDVGDAAHVVRCLLMGIGVWNDEPTEDNVRDMAEAERMFMMDDTLYSYRNTLIAEVDGELAGAMIAYDGGRSVDMRAKTFPHLSFFRGQNMDSITPETGEGEYYFDTLAFMPQFRGRGFGRRLFEFALDDMRTQHPTLTGTLLVDPDNARALALYTSLGFRQSGEVFVFGQMFRKMALSRGAR